MPESPRVGGALARNAVVFVRLLRRSGLAVSTDQAVSLVQALELIDVGEKPHVYHAARCLLVNRREDLGAFDLAFHRFWSEHAGARAGSKALDRRPKLTKTHGQGRFMITTYADHLRELVGPEVEVLDRSETYSPEERLHHKSFAELTAEELDTVGALIRDLRWKVALRRTRRHVPHRRGEAIDLRATLRETAKHAGVAIRLKRRSRKIKPRPVILLADISGSMEKYSSLVLQFFFAVSSAMTEVECFVFGTRLSRITPELRIRSVDRAIEEASRRVSDWAGGTRVGECLSAFNHEWGRRLLRRGAIVIIISDGCDRGDVDLLRKELRHVQHRCHRLLWLNPLLGSPGYEPLVGGMAAALDYVDEFLPVHNLRSLQELAERLALIPPHRRRMRRVGGRTLRSHDPLIDEGAVHT